MQYPVTVQTNSLHYINPPVQPQLGSWRQQQFNGGVRQQPSHTNISRSLVPALVPGSQFPIRNNLNHQRSLHHPQSGWITGGGQLFPGQFHKGGFVRQYPPMVPSQMKHTGPWKKRKGQQQHKVPCLEIGGKQSQSVNFSSQRLDMQVSTVSIPGDLVVRGTSIILDCSTTLRQFHELLDTHKWYTREAITEHAQILQFIKTASSEFKNLYHEFEFLHTTRVLGEKNNCCTTE